MKAHTPHCGDLKFGPPKPRKYPPSEAYSCMVANLPPVNPHILTRMCAYFQSCHFGCPKAHTSWGVNAACATPVVFYPVVSPIPMAGEGALHWLLLYTGLNVHAVQWWVVADLQKAKVTASHVSSEPVTWQDILSYIVCYAYAPTMSVVIPSWNISK